MDTPDASWLENWHVRIIEETGSTNADLRLAAGSGAPHRSVLMARHQTAGRGRLDRRWDAPSGANLLVSILFRVVPDRANELTQRLGLAVVAGAATFGVDAGLKWPNDVLVGDAKLAGILAERGDGWVVAGLGLNVGWAPGGAAKLGEHLDPVDVLRTVLTELDRLPTDIVPGYRTALATLGRQVTVQRANGDVVGRALDVDDEGRLLVLDDCAITHVIDTGDVIHLR